MGAGNLLEDAINCEPGSWPLFLGALALIASLFVAGVSALTVTSPRRWSWLLLLGGAGGAKLGFGLLLMGSTWIAFATSIHRHLRVVDATPAPLWSGQSC
jgi:hypothetical protein